MQDQSKIASVALDLLGRAQFRHIELVGSVAAKCHDPLSDVDILIRDHSRSPRANVEIASQLLQSHFGHLLSDWATSLLPHKYLISLFLPGFPLYWHIDIGCYADPDYPDLNREEVVVDSNSHLAKLLIINAKHYIRGDQTQLRIDDLYRKAIPHGTETMVASKFQAVFDAIDYRELEPELLQKSQAIITEVKQ